MSSTYPSPSGRVVIWADGERWALWIDDDRVDGGDQGADECARACGLLELVTADPVVRAELGHAARHLAPTRPR